MLTFDDQWRAQVCAECVSRSWIRRASWDSCLK